MADMNDTRNKSTTPDINRNKDNTNRDVNRTGKDDSTRSSSDPKDAKKTDEQADDVQK